jgi:hypothetical protein
VKNNLIKYNIGGHFLFMGIIVIIMAVNLFLVYCGYNDKLNLQEKFNNNNHIAQAHFFGASENVNNYQIIFQPFPFVPFAGDNSTTLNFSILDNNNSNVDNVYSALVITEKIPVEWLDKFHIGSMNLVILLFGTHFKMLATM